MLDENTFIPGDTVRRTNGGPVMTVSSVTIDAQVVEPMVACTWYVGVGGIDYMYDTFPASKLMRHKEFVPKVVT